jgi:hypothetical protein
VPKNRTRSLLRRRSEGAKALNLIHSLGIKMDFPTVLKRKAFDLLDDTAFRPVVAV